MAIFKEGPTIQWTNEKEQMENYIQNTTQKTTD
jgi:hypothetical protein